MEQIVNFLDRHGLWYRYRKPRNKIEVFVLEPDGTFLYVTVTRHSTGEYHIQVNNNLIYKTYRPEQNLVEFKSILEDYHII